MVPMFSIAVAVALMVKGAPPWQLPHPALSNVVLPATAAVVSELSALRYGVDAKRPSEPTYAASASRSALTPAFLSPSG